MACFLFVRLNRNVIKFMLINYSISLQTKCSIWYLYFLSVWLLPISDHPPTLLKGDLPRIQPNHASCLQKQPNLIPLLLQHQIWLLPANTSQVNGAQSATSTKRGAQKGLPSRAAPTATAMGQIHGASSVIRSRIVCRIVAKRPKRGSLYKILKNVARITKGCSCSTSS